MLQVLDHRSGSCHAPAIQGDFKKCGEEWYWCGANWRKEWKVLPGQYGMVSNGFYCTPISCSYVITLPPVNCTTSSNFVGKYCFLVGPERRRNSNLVGFGPFWAFGTRRNSGPGRKTQKHNFPVLGALLWEKDVTTLSGMVFRNFLDKAFFWSDPHRPGIAI